MPRLGASVRDVPKEKRAARRALGPDPGRVGRRCVPHRSRALTLLAAVRACAREEGAGTIRPRSLFACPGKRALAIPFDLGATWGVR